MKRWIAIASAVVVATVGALVGTTVVSDVGGAAPDCDKTPQATPCQGDDQPGNSGSEVACDGPAAEHNPHCAPDAATGDDDDDTSNGPPADDDDDDTSNGPPADDDDDVTSTGGGSDDAEVAGVVEVADKDDSAPVEPAPVAEPQEAEPRFTG